MYTELQKSLMDAEGYNDYAYQDSLGYWTIGWGRCIDSRKGPGINHDEALYLLNNDIESARNDLKDYAWYSRQSQIRKDALVEICFNMGLGHLFKFPKALAALSIDDYETAVKEFEAPLWISEVGKHRIDNIMFRLKYDAYPK